MRIMQINNGNYSKPKNQQTFQGKFIPTEDLGAITKTSVETLNAMAGKAPDILGKTIIFRLEKLPGKNMFKTIANIKGSGRVATTYRGQTHFCDPKKDLTDLLMEDFNNLCLKLAEAFQVKELYKYIDPIQKNSL